MKKDHKKNSSSVSLLDASGLAIKSVKVVEGQPKSRELEDLIRKQETHDPIQYGSEMTPEHVQFEHDKAYLTLNLYLSMFPFVDVNRMNSDPDVQKRVEALCRDFLTKHPPPSGSKVDFNFKLSATDYALQLRALRDFGQLLGMTKTDPIKIYFTQDRLNKLVVQLKNEGHLKLKGFQYLLAEVLHDKSNEELRAAFRRHKLPEPSIKLFFRTHSERKQRQGQPEEFAIYQAADGSYYYNRVDPRSQDKIVERGISSGDDAFKKVGEMNK